MKKTFIQSNTVKNVGSNLFIVGNDLSSSTLYVLDISNPLGITESATYSLSGTTDIIKIAVNTTWAIIIDNTNNSIRILNVSNLSNISERLNYSPVYSQIGSVSSYKLLEVCSFPDSDDWFFLSMGGYSGVNNIHNTSEIKSINVSNLISPLATEPEVVYTAIHTYSQYHPIELLFKDENIFSLDHRRTWSSGYEDFTTVSLMSFNPVSGFTEFITTQTSTLSPSIDGGIDYFNDHLYLAHDDICRVFEVKPDDLEEQEDLEVNTTGDISSLICDDGFILTAAGKFGLFGRDVYIEAEFFNRIHYGIASNKQLDSVFLHGDYLFSWGQGDSTSEEYFYIFDCSDPEDINQIALIENTIESVAVSPYEMIAIGEYLFISHRYGNSIDTKIFVYNISDIENPVYISSFESELSHIANIGDYLYVANGSPGVSIFDISDPMNFKIKGIIPVDNDVTSLYLYGDIFYFLDEDSSGSETALKAYDISDPINPYLIKYRSITSISLEILDVNDKYMILSDDSKNGFDILDTDKSNSTFIESIDDVTYDSNTYVDAAKMEGVNLYLYLRNSVNSNYNDIRCLDFSDPSNVNFGYTTHINISSTEKSGMDIKGEYLFAADPVEGIFVIDLIK